MVFWWGPPGCGVGSRRCRGSEAQRDAVRALPSGGETFFFFSVSCAGTLQREQQNATLGKVVPWKDMRMSRVLRYDNGKLQVVQEVDGKDKATGREWHSMKANYGRLEKVCCLLLPVRS